MSNNVSFEGKERRMAGIEKCMAEYGIKDLEEAREICLSKGVNCEEIVKGVQGIAFENAVWAYTLGCAVAIKKNVKTAAEASEAIGIGLQAFCVPGSVAQNRKVGLGHGNLGAMLLSEETKCFCFLAGHESFAAAEGAIGIARTANKVRKEPLRVILNGLGKDAAFIISRINGFTYVCTDYDPFNDELKVVYEKAYSDGDKAKVKCYGANDVLEGVAIMKHEGVDVSITGTPLTLFVSSTSLPEPTRSGLSRTARSTSLSRPAEARVVPCIRTTWARAPRPMVLPTRWVVCTATLSSLVPPLSRHTSR